MQMTGYLVHHKTFGRGTITALSDQALTVSFPQGEKKFLYPEAFSNFLTLEDPAAQCAVKARLARDQKAETARRQAMQAKLEREQRLRSLRLSPNAQAIFDLDAASAAEAFRNWSVSTGCYLSGASRGEPRRPDRLQPNSACLLTGCPVGQPERERRILGAFMVQDDFLGDLCRDGQIEAHAQFRFRLAEDALPRLWDFFAPEQQPPRWGSMRFKYFSTPAMQRILSALREQLAGQPEAETADEFYRYFCRLNRLSDGLTVPDEAETDG